MKYISNLCTGAKYTKISMFVSNLLRPRLFLDYLCHFTFFPLDVCLVQNTIVVTGNSGSFIQAS